MTGARTLPLPPMEGPIIAGFALPRADDGATLLIRSFRGRKALALYFLHDATCAGCRALLAGVLPRYGDYAFAGAEPVAIVPGSISAVAGLRRDLALPFPTLVDEAGAVARRYGVAGEAALLIADRYGAPALWVSAGAGHELPKQDAVLRELDYLSHSCGGGCATPAAGWSVG